MIIKCVERETTGLPSKRTRIDTNDRQILNHTALPAEARFPHVFKDGECDEKVSYRTRSGTRQYQLRR